MRKNASIRLRFCTGSALLAALAAAPALAINWTIDITVDNAYGIYWGTPAAVDTFVGNDASWATVETYSVQNRAASDYIYVAAWSDASSWQGFLAEFAGTNGRVLTGDPQWRVYPTGRRMNVNDPPPSLATMTTQIAAANSSNGWKATTSGWANDGSLWNGGTCPWGAPRQQIDQQSKWIWYNSGKDNDQFAPFNGFDHGEFLIFRLPGAATPEPSSFGLLALGATALLRRRGG